MSESPRTAYISFREILDSGCLSDALRAQIRLALADDVDVDGARTRFERAVIAGVDPREIARNRRGQSNDPRTRAALSFALDAARTAGDIEEPLLDLARKAGWRDDEIAEMVALVALHLLDGCLAPSTPPRVA